VEGGKRARTRDFPVFPAKTFAFATIVSQPVDDVPLSRAFSFIAEMEQIVCRFAVGDAVKNPDPACVVFSTVHHPSRGRCRGK
jgi:hypothetical protein